MQKLLLICLLFACAPAVGQTIQFDLMSTAPPPAVTEPTFVFDVLHVAPTIVVTSTKRPEKDFKFDLLAVPSHGSIGPASSGAVPPNRAMPGQARPVVPVVLAYVTGCKSCADETAKTLAARDLPFTVEWRKAPEWVSHSEQEPCFHWQAADGKWKRIYTSSPETLTEAWRKTIDVPVTTSASGYPTRSNHWSHPGNTREAIIVHLLTGAEHRGKFTRAQLERLSLQELEGLHSDDHDSRVQWSRLPPSSATRQSPRVVGAVAALGYKQGSTGANIAARVQSIFEANVNLPPTQLVAAANGQGVSAKEAKESKKNLRSTVQSSASV